MPFRENWVDDMHWEWVGTIPEPLIEKVSAGNQTQSRIRLNGFENESRLGYSALPVYERIFNALPSDILYVVQLLNEKESSAIYDIESFADYPKTGKYESGSINQVGGGTQKHTFPYPLKNVSVHLLGYYRGMPLSKMSIYPCTLLNNDHDLHYYQNISVTVEIRENSDFKRISAKKVDPLIRSLGIESGMLRKSRQRKVEKNISNPLVNISAMKIVLAEDGIYRIHKESLIDSGAVLTNVDPRNFKMYNKGIPYPIYVAGESDGKFDKNDYIEFYAERNRNVVLNYEYSPFTDKNVFWLIWDRGDGLRYAEESAKPTVRTEEAIAPQDYYYTVHAESNAYFETLGQVDIDLPTHVRDHWFFDSGISAGTTKQYSFALPDPNTHTLKNFDVLVGMHGLTYEPGRHNVQFYINDYYAGSGSWAGQTYQIIRNDATQVLQNRFLSSGYNSLRIAVAGDDPTSMFDRVLFDWIEVKYYRLYQAFNNALDFVKPEDYPFGRYHFKISNFNEPDVAVYKIGKSRLVGFDLDYVKSTDTYSILVEDDIQSENVKYFASSAEGIKTPVSIQPDTVMNIIENYRSANLNVIIISPEEWRGEFNELIQYYEENGLRAAVFTINDIYNTFNNGVISPYAVRDFLAQVQEEWNPAPDYVLLVGNAKVKEEVSVPTFFYQTYKYGASACDHWFTTTGYDERLPEFAIGRWPCSRIEELRTLIRKRIGYQNNSFKGPWRDEILFIAGKEDVFKDQSEEMIHNQITKEYGINRIYINPSSMQTPFWGGSDTLIALFNDGIVLANFMGHGGGAVWADRSLFNTSHIPFLDNLDRLPFLTSMTCFTGDFAVMEGLGRHVLMAENGGAIGLWGTSSVGWIKNDYLLAKPFYDAIFTPDISVGKAIQAAKIKYMTDQEYFDYLKPSLVYSYNLIGDPTVKLAFPEQNVWLSPANESIEPGGSIRINGQLPFSGGQFSYQVYDKNKYRRLDESVTTSFSGQNAEFDIELPATIEPGESFINYYLLDNSGIHDAHGSVTFTIEGLQYSDFRATPIRPGEGEDIRFFIRADVENILSMECQIDTVSAYSYLDENGIEHTVSFLNQDQILSIPMRKFSDESFRWELSQPFKVDQSGRLLAVRFLSKTIDGVIATSPNYTIKMKSQPDFLPVRIEQGGEKYPALVTMIDYYGDDTITLHVSAEKILSDGTEQIFGQCDTDFFPNLGKRIEFPGILGHDLVSFRVSVDPANAILESNEENNELYRQLEITHFPLLPEFGTTYDGKSHDTLSVSDAFQFAVQANALSDSSVVILKSDSTLTCTQPDFTIINAFSQNSNSGFEVQMRNQLDFAENSIFVGLMPDTLFQETSVGRLEPSLGIWLKEQSVQTGNRLSSNVSGIGKFALIRTRDNVGPAVEVNLEGQNFFENTFVSRRPNISIIAEDENGIRFDRLGLKVWIDEQILPFEKIQIVDTLSNANHIATQFRPELEWGDHTISVTVLDAAGNLTAESIHFTVSDELRLIDYGNFPNPFQDKTMFVYEITQRVDKLQIKIYTISGRLIHCLDENSVYSTGGDIHEGGYHEIIWEGQDGQGNFVANGVYFYKIIAKKDGKEVHSIGKIAKAR